MADTQSLNALLRAVHLLEALYARGLAAPGLLAAGSAERAAAETIRGHLAGHAGALRALGATRPAPAVGSVDFTGGRGSGNGPFSPFASVDGFLRLAQPLEDLAVRAALGALEAQGADAAAARAVAAMLGAHARHAARVRQLREAVSFIDVKPWVTGGYAGYDLAFEPAYAGLVAAVYGGEENRAQPPFTFPEHDAASTEAFDEPLSAQAVDAATSAFVAP